MLEEKDLQAIREVMKSEIVASEERTKEYIDARFTESENLVLGEVERVREILENQIAQVKKNMEELNQYYRITKLENDNTALLLKMIDELSKRVEELEKKTA